LKADGAVRRIAKPDAEEAAMARKTRAGEKLPEPFEKFMKGFPEVFAGYDAMGKAAHAGGPLDAKTRELVKLGMAIGARLEGATHSHVRKALAAGVTAKEIRHATVLAIATLGLPTTIMAFTWIDDVLDGKRRR
jgi:alkylhydroperoxidase/carboxymuconolactone decarboxylase family protein YurZ